jgi:murein L,D-transpeptidase YcbB/YkuD
LRSFATPSALVLLTLALAASADPVSDGIRERVEAVRASAAPKVAGEVVASTTILPRLYERRQFRPAWSEASAASLIRALRRAPEHGLRPGDYHLAALERREAAVSAGQRDPQLLADRDVLLTDALIRIAYHAIFGKVDPVALDPHWNMERGLSREDPASEIQRIIDSGDVLAQIRARAPSAENYRRLRDALARYRKIEAAGGWQPVPPGDKLEVGSRGPRVLAVRARLAAAGDLPRHAASSPVFDESLANAVRSFQKLHRIDPDGVIGPGTLEAMNVPVEARIDQLRVNLERARWVLGELPEEYVMVDIAGFEAAYFRRGKRIWHSRVQVGRPYRRTPVFRDEIQFLEINPTWTVPPGILSKDVLPKIREDVGYLEKNRMTVRDRQGRVVDPASIDWAQARAQSFPHRIVQEPGPANALGSIKIMFPNPHLVYLHDTPSRSLFERSQRAFSSGCIRVQEPWELASLLLDDPQLWGPEQLEAVLETGETRRIDLARKVPVLLLYWTVLFEPDGSLAFKQDLYDRDPPILEALEADFRFHQRHVDELGAL